MEKKAILRLFRSRECFTAPKQIEDIIRLFFFNTIFFLRQQNVKLNVATVEMLNGDLLFDYLKLIIW